MALAKPAKVSILNYWHVAYALLAGYFLFDETYTLLSLPGIGVMSSGVECVFCGGKR